MGSFFPQKSQRLMRSLRKSQYNRYETVTIDHWKFYVHISGIQLFVLFLLLKWGYPYSVCKTRLSFSLSDFLQMAPAIQYLQDESCFHLQIIWDQRSQDGHLPSPESQPGPSAFSGKLCFLTVTGPVFFI